MKIKLYGTVKDIEKQNLQLISDSQDVLALKEYLGNDEDLKEFECFFVKIKNGEYKTIYGINNNIPYIYEDIYKISLPVTL